MRFIKEAKSRLIKSSVYRSFQLLPKKDQHKLVKVIIIQFILGVLDLIGVVLIGLTASLTVSGIQSQNPGKKIEKLLNLLHLEKLVFQYQVILLATLACTFLILRTIFSIVTVRKIYYFLSYKSADISKNLLLRVLNFGSQGLKTKSDQENLYALTTGVGTITIGILATTVNMFSDIFLFIIMFTGLVFIDSTVAISSLIIFSFIGYLMYKFTQFKATQLGIKIADLTIKNNDKILEIMKAYREMFVKNRRYFYADEIAKGRYAIANLSAQASFLPNISKYVLETVIVISALAISGIQFYAKDASHAIATLSVFLVTGTRIAPAVMRMQQNLLVIKTSTGSAKLTLEMVEMLSTVKQLDPPNTLSNYQNSDFSSTIAIENLEFSYQNSTDFKITIENLVIHEGETVAIVGPSGSGKSTLIDLMLGLLEPTSGKISISGLKPTEAIAKWPGSIAYIPQDVYITNGSINENVVLGFQLDTFNESAVIESLELASLDNFAKKTNEGIHKDVGEGGYKLSGGQRQRLGIARALLTKPTLLIMDESTSSLDGETELNINKNIKMISRPMTTIVIAHRLSTLRECKKVIYLNSGKIEAIGTFLEVRNKVQNFDYQARILGL